MRASGILIIALGALMTLQAVMPKGTAFALLWPALAFLTVGCSYLLRSPRCFGKKPDGDVRTGNRILLSPYLALAQLAWHATRILSRERSYDQLQDNVWIGRRLLASEASPPAEVLVDLTCEFAEPSKLRRRFREYVAIPILDKGIPRCLSTFAERVALLAEQDGGLYVHCAQGHGRAGMVAAAILLVKNSSLSAEDAIATVRRARPGVALSDEQTAFLRDVREVLVGRSAS